MYLLSLWWWGYKWLFDLNSSRSYLRWAHWRYVVQLLCLILMCLNLFAALRMSSQHQYQTFRQYLLVPVRLVHRFSTCSGMFSLRHRTTGFVFMVVPVWPTKIGTRRAVSFFKWSNSIFPKWWFYNLTTDIGSCWEISLCDVKTNG